jgi:AcrR family transcriptional regulator
MKHQEMREATSRAIMDAFWSLYRDLPVEKITVKAICEKAGCNRSTFYEYYTDSYSVLEAIEEELLDYVRRKLTEELPASLARSFPEIRLDAETLAPLSDMYSKKGEYFSILTGVKGDPYFQYKYKQTIKDLLTEMLDDPAKKFDLSASIVAEFTASALIGAFNCWYPHRDEYPVEKYSLLLVNLLTNGVLPAIQKL